MSNDERLMRLKEIQYALEDIRALIAITNQERIEEVRKRLLKEGSMKRRIYDLCEGTKTAQDIARAIQKPVEYVNSYLSILRREGLIATFEKEGKAVHRHPARTPSRNRCG